MTDVKICGIKDPENLKAAIDSGARYIGLVFYPPSPRHIEFDTACELARMIPTGIRTVGLFVNPTDKQIEDITGKVQLDMIQLHGDETPDRITEIKSKTLMPIIKAVNIRTTDDLQNIEEYETVSDMILFDAKAPKLETQNSKPNYGGTGKTFDWNLLKNQKFTKPWMLSGGLNTGNIQAALEILNPNAVDISSGVESARGIKDATLIKQFIDKVKSIG